MRRAGSLVMLLAMLPALLVGSACQAVARVTVAVRPGGDGDVIVTLRLDKEATARFARLGALLKVEDMRRAGWVVSSPLPGADGSATVTASRHFGDPSEASTVLSQLSGQTGPLHALGVRYHRSAVSTRTSVSGTVDLTQGPDAFADPGLAAQLGFPSVAEALAKFREASSINPTLQVEVAVRLPGGSDRSPGARVERGVAVWNVPFGKSVPIAASSTRRNWLNLGLLGVGAASLLALFGVLAAQRLGYSGRRRRGRW